MIFFGNFLIFFHIFEVFVTLFINILKFRLFFIAKYLSIKQTAGKKVIAKGFSLN